MTTEKPTLTFGHLKITDHLLLGIAKEHRTDGAAPYKYFQLETKVYRGWNPLADDLKAGELDGAFILAPLAMEIFYSHQNIQMILQAHKSGSIVIKNRRANIERVEDFKGKNVLIPHYLSVHHLLFDRLLRENGLEIGPGKDVILDVVAPSDIPEIIEWDEKGQVGGFIVAEPFGTQVVKAGYGDEFVLSKDLWPNHPCCVVVVKKEVIEKYPDAVYEFTTSLVEAGQFVENQPDQASQIGSQFLGQSFDVVKTVLTTPKDRVTYAELKPVIDDFEYMQTYLTTKIKAMSDKIDLEKFIDYRFAEAAKAQ
ncbi:MAG: twin-arginine translocation pathway signal protein [Anaerolineae bacterium]|jgi:NitT/TauT family transport system substrate-binding protein|nr:MAG: twin-arginine translocation pathway signal protein [Anaerolineae bacterium]